MIPDIDQLILGLVAYRHRHNIQTGGYYLSVAISTRPTNGLFASTECLLLGHPFNQLTSHVIDLDGDISWLVQGERNSGVCAKAITFGREDPWLAGQ